MPWAWLRPLPSAAWYSPNESGPQTRRKESSSGGLPPGSKAPSRNLPDCTGSSSSAAVPTIDAPRFRRMIPVMKSLRTALLLALVAVWAPMSMHCRLVEWPAFDFLACCENEKGLPYGGEDCRGDACDVIESGQYKPQSVQRWILPLTLASVTWSRPGDISVPPVRTWTPVAGSLAPPELAVGWQFHWRVAASPRAPSSTG